MDDRAGMVRAARAWLGMEQAALAEAAGITRQTLRLAEQGTMTDKTWSKVRSAAAARGILFEESDVLRRVT